MQLAFGTGGYIYEYFLINVSKCRILVLTIHSFCDSMYLSHTFGGYYVLYKLW